MIVSSIDNNEKTKVLRKESKINLESYILVI